MILDSKPRKLKMNILCQNTGNPKWIKMNLLANMCASGWASVCAQRAQVLHAQVSAQNVYGSFGPCVHRFIHMFIFTCSFFKIDSWATNKVYFGPKVDLKNEQLGEYSACVFTFALAWAFSCALTCAFICTVLTCAPRISHLRMTAGISLKTLFTRFQIQLQ